MDGTLLEHLPVSICLLLRNYPKDRSEEKEKGRLEMASTAAVPFCREAAEALNHEKVHFSISKWTGGKAEKP
ncbi:unnamed protein product, partial [Eruca vesicaria subsp. sativa]|nr:unnamed protein product [Eruca vesicaria subsp. sativa]CAH8302821.1 unnamed protein product [Eruca vesicaria subsp. sativa]